MNIIFTNIKYLILPFVFISTGIIATAQKKLGLEPDQWAIELSKEKLTEINSMGSLSVQLMGTDSLRALRVLDSIEISPNAKGHFFVAHFCMVKAKFLYDRFLDQNNLQQNQPDKLKNTKEQIKKLFADALDAAYFTEDDITIGWVSFYSAKIMRNFGEISWAVMYSTNGVDLFEKEGYDVEPTVYTDLADLLYYVREYDESIRYAKKGVAGWAKVKDEKEFKNSTLYRIRALNIAGVSYYEKKGYDSAVAYYQLAMELAKKSNNTVWIGVLSGNIGRIMFAQNNFDSAYSLFITDYQNNHRKGIYDHAANALQWAAKANLAMGDKMAAVDKAREALQLLHRWPNGSYLRNTCQTLTAIFRALNNYDSSFYYNDRYNALKDSLEKEVVTSSLHISKVKLNNEVSRYKIQNLTNEKREQLIIRNSLLAAIVVLLLIALLMINSSRLKHKMLMEKAQQEKMLMEQEIRLAKEQMNIFTSNTIEKTNLIEKLELQIKDRQATAEQAAILSELMQHTILTEEDWIKFKTLFEKIYPSFFQHLKEKSADITLAEQRMAALTRMQLTSKQMAAMLGISVDSVHKTRQRLRQRLQLSSDTNLDEYVAGI